MTLSKLYTPEEVEEFFLNAAKTIYSCYVRRYINNRAVSLPKTEYDILQECHCKFLKTKEFVTVHTVSEMINNLDFSRMSKVLQNIINKPMETHPSNPYNVKKSLPHNYMYNHQPITIPHRFKILQNK